MIGPLGGVSHFLSIRWLLLLAIPSIALAQTRPENRSSAQGSSGAIADDSAGRVTPAMAKPRDRSTIEQPGALAPIFERLYLLGAGGAPRPVHILHFGDSHSAADDWTAELRRLLKERFGDGGSGFSLAGKPYSGYRRFDVQGGGSSSGWRAEGFLSGSGDGRFGLGGISSSTRVEGESMFLETDCDHLEVDYLQQPDGGDLALYDRDRLLQRFSTKGKLGSGFLTFQPAKGPHRFVLKTVTSRPIRLFGWVADKDRGVTYETLGINGAEASILLRWDEEMFRAYLQRRAPALIVLAYGTNEAVSGVWTSERYQAMFSKVLYRIHDAVPKASILILGPPDSWSNREGGRRPAPGVDRIIAAQKAACREIGCGFWDTRERMGGLGSMRDWVQAGLAQRDYIHFTPAGYRRLAAMLFADLMRDYELFQKVRLEIAGFPAR